MKSRKVKNLIFSLGAMLLSTCAVLIVLEIGCRILFFQPRGRVAAPHEFQMSKLEGVPYELTPNHSWIWKYGPRRVLDRGFSIPVQTNSHGYRDSELVEPAPPNEFRFLAIGDSFTLGLGVRVEDCWVERLEDLLNSRDRIFPPKDYSHVEVINTGVGSWNTEVEYHFLRQKGMTHNPDAVILGFLVNDFHCGNGEHIIDDRGFLVTKGAADSRLHLQSLLYDEKTKKSLWERIIEGSHLVRWASGRKMKYETQTLMEFVNSESKERTFDAIRGIRHLTNEAAIPLYVCIFPYVEDVMSEADRANLAAIADLCRSLDIPCIHMENALGEKLSASLWVHPKDRHPNAAAHNLYAEYIFRQFFGTEQ